ncbi:MAG: ABC transporter ATP-binding protein [Bacteroidales bacterium]|jgi:peptide/nickel transport system ATP-binding protein|nr:ABC transporter ATP-binding protein [Bacteroidales bacterium]
MNPVLKVENLTISFDNNIVVNDFSLSINKGEVVGVVGESGSGKSVSVLSFLRLLPKNSEVIKGSAELYTESNGKVDLYSISDSEIRKLRGGKISFVFQEPMTSLNPSMICGKQVLEALDKKITDNRKEAVKKLFKEVMLPEPDTVYNKYPHELSGGQRQRVMIAMAIAGEPDIIIADEPTTALDVTVQREIIDLLLDIKNNRGTSIIFISHDLDVVSAISDKIIVMQNGVVVESGECSKVINNPESLYTKGLLLCKPSKQKRLKKLPVVNDFVKGKQFDAVVEDTGSRKKRHKELYAEKPILSVKNLKVTLGQKRTIFGKTFGGKNVVDKISFDLYRGETLGLVGESGSGKTTIGRSLNLLLNSRYDSYKLFGKNISETGGVEVRKRVQMIFQDPYSSLNPKMRVGDAILEVLNHHNSESASDNKKSVADMLNRVGLSEEAYKKYPHEFSGGQRQRVGIARSLILKPDIIICDESVSALDVSVQAMVLNLLNKLKHEMNLSMIFISHDLAVVKHMSDRIMVLKEGNLIEIEEADKLFESSKSDYTRKLIDSVY